MKYSLDGSLCSDGDNRKTVRYGAGNMVRKSDICGAANCFHYDGGSDGPDRLTSIDGTYNDVQNPTFQYDANGNMTSGAGRSFNWTASNMVSKITQGSVSAEIAYGPEHERYKMCEPDCTAPTATTLYLYDPATGGMSEKVTDGSTVTWRDTIVVDGQIVAERFDTNGAVVWRYFVGDHLGSTTTLTDTVSPTPNPVERDSGACPPARLRDRGNAWGKRRNPDATDDPACSIASLTTRGFTGHEMLDDFCLINMNGRIYDPGLGHFLSADDRVPNPFDGRSYNRYSYLNNNPLNGTDPTGHESYWDKLTAAIWAAIQSINGTGYNETVVVNGYGGYDDNWGTDDPGYWGDGGNVLNIFSGGGYGRGEGAGAGQQPMCSDPACQYHGPIETVPVTAPPFDDDFGDPFDLSLQAFLLDIFTRTVSGTKTCSPVTARILKGNSKLIGKPGAFGPLNPVAPGSAAVIPNQWGGRANLSLYANEVSGTFEESNGGSVSFNGITDVIGGQSPIPGMNVRDALEQLNGNGSILILELPSAPRDFGTLSGSVRMPASGTCPAGTQ